MNWSMIWVKPRGAPCRPTAKEAPWSSGRARDEVGVVGEVAEVDDVGARGPGVGAWVRDGTRPPEACAEGRARCDPLGPLEPPRDAVAPDGEAGTLATRAPVARVLLTASNLYSEGATRGTGAGG